MSILRWWDQKEIHHTGFSNGNVPWSPYESWRVNPGSGSGSPPWPDGVPEEVPGILWWRWSLTCSLKSLQMSLGLLMVQLWDLNLHKLGYGAPKKTQERWWNLIHLAEVHPKVCKMKYSQAIYHGFALFGSYLLVWGESKCKNPWEIHPTSKSPSFEIWFLKIDPQIQWFISLF